MSNVERGMADPAKQDPSLDAEAEAEREARATNEQGQDRTQAAIDAAFGLEHGGDFTHELGEQNIFLAKPSAEECKLYGLQQGETVAVSDEGIYQLPREQFNAREQAIHGQWFEETQETYEARDFDAFMERARHFDSVADAHAKTTPERVAERAAEEARFLDEYEAQKAQVLGEAAPTPEIEHPQEPAPALGEIAKTENMAGMDVAEWREPSKDDLPDLAPSVDEAQILDQGGEQRPETEYSLAAPPSHFAFALGDSAPVTQLNPSGPAPEKGSTGVGETRAPQIDSGTAERDRVTEAEPQSLAPEWDSGEKNREAAQQIESSLQAADPGREESVSEPALPEARAERGEETKLDVALDAPQSPAPDLAPDALDGVATAAARVADAGLEIAGQALEVVGDIFEGLLGFGSAPSAPPTEADIQKGQAIAEAKADDRAARIAARAERLQMDIADYQQRQTLEQEEGLGLGRKRDE